MSDENDNNSKKLRPSDINTIGEPVNVDELEVRLLVIVKNENPFMNVRTFLDRRGWPTTITNSMNEAIKVLATDRPDYILVSLNHPSPKIGRLPVVLAQTFNVECIVFGEETDLKTVNKISGSRAPHKITGPISGPMLHRRIKQILNDKFNPKDIKTKSSRNMEKGGNESGSDPANPYSSGIGQSDIVQIKGGNSKSSGVGESKNNPAYSQEMLSRLAREMGGEGNSETEVGSSKKGIVFQKGQEQQGPSLRDQLEKRGSDSSHGRDNNNANFQGMGVGRSGNASGIRRESRGLRGTMEPDEKGNANIRSGQVSREDEKSGDATFQSEPSQQDARWEEFLEKEKNKTEEPQVRQSSTQGEEYSAEEEKGQRAAEGKVTQQGPSRGEEMLAERDQTSDNSGVIVQEGLKGPGGTRAEVEEQSSEDSLWAHQQAESLDSNHGDSESKKEAGRYETPMASEDSTAEGIGQKSSRSEKGDVAGSSSDSIEGENEALLDQSGEEIIQSYLSTQITPEGSLLFEAVKLATEKVARPMESSFEQSQEVTQFNIMPLLGDGSNGYILIAHTDVNQMDAALLNNFRSHLLESVGKENKNFQLEPSYLINVNSVELQPWLNSVSEFYYETKCHNGKLTAGFISSAKPLPEIRRDQEHKKLVINVNDVSSDKPVAFNAYLYFSGTNRYINYLNPGSCLLQNKKDRLLSSQVDFYLDISDKDKFIKHYCTHELNSLIKKYKDSLKLPKAS